MLDLVKYRMKLTEITQRILWHSSDVPNIKQFHFLSHVGTWAAAVERSLQKDFFTDMLAGDQASKTYMYQVNMDGCDKGIQVLDGPNFSEKFDHIYHNTSRMPQELQPFLRKSSYDDWEKKLPGMFRKLGIDFLWYHNRIESPNSRSYIVLNPKCFKIMGMQAYTPREILLANPKVIDLFVRRGVWTKWQAQKVRDLLR